MSITEKDLQKSELKTHILSMAKTFELYEEFQAESSTRFLTVTIDPLFNELEKFHESQIRRICKMPLEDELGVFIFDMFGDLIGDVASGEKSVNQVIDICINWKVPYRRRTP